MLQKTHIHGGIFHDETGKKYGYLTVVRKNPIFKTLHKIKQHAIYWDCVCDCGRTTTVSGVKLRAGTTKSCGCYKSSNAHMNQEIALTNMLNNEIDTEYDCAAMKHLYSFYRCRARNKKQSFLISLDQFQKITSSKCHYCGRNPSSKKKGTKFIM
jgi:hypothetical protein